MKVLFSFLIMALLLSTIALYYFYPFPIEKVEAEPSFDNLKDQLIGQSFLRADLPPKEKLLEIAPDLKKATIERFYPFQIKIKLERQKVIQLLSIGEEKWELLESGRMVRTSTTSSAVVGKFFTFPLPEGVSSALAMFLSKFPANLRGEITIIEVASPEEIVLQLNEMRCFFLLSNYERHLPYLQVYINAARKDGKQELHFEYSEVFAK